MTGPLFVLRFRDLATDPGETIQFHQQSIASHEECWWGWWGREHELLTDSIGDLLHVPTDIALFDTDGMRVYKARCEEKRISSVPQLSPAPKLTPSYYNNKRVRAWFCLSDIVESQPDWLIGRACIWTADTSIDAGWVVPSLVPLKKSDATLWVLADRNSGSADE